MQRNRGKQQNGKDLFKKIRDTKGTFHAKVVTRKDIKGMDLTEAKYIKKWQDTRDGFMSMYGKTNTILKSN